MSGRGKIAVLCIITVAFFCSVCPALCAEATAEPPSDDLADTLERLAIEKNIEALEHFKKKNYPAALRGFKSAYKLDPGNAEIVNNLAYLYHLLGNDTESERLYRKTLELDPARYIALLNLADLLGKQGRNQEDLAEAAKLYARAREIKGNDPKIVLKQARVAARLGLFGKAATFYKSIYDYGGKVTEELLLETGDFYRDFDQDELALEQYRQIKLDPELSAVAAKRIWELEVSKQARRFRWQLTKKTVAPKAKRLATKGRILLNQGKFEEAEKMLTEAIAISPTFAMARADLAELYRQTERREMAELSLLKALSMDSASAEIMSRLGNFYMDPEERKAPEAVFYLERALELQPDWTMLHLPLAKALRETGNLLEALRHTNAFLDGVQDEAKAGEAAELKGELEKALPENALAVLSPGSSQEPGVENPLESKLEKTLARVQAFLIRGETEAAMAALSGLPDNLRNGQVYNLEARILYSAGKLGDALGRLEKAVEKGVHNAGTYLLFGQIYKRRKDREAAEKYFGLAAGMGEQAAVYEQIALKIESRGNWQWAGDIPFLPVLFKASDQLDSLAAEATLSVIKDKSLALKTQTDKRIRRSIFILGAFSVFLIAVFVGHRRIKYGGMDIGTFLDKHPEASPDIQAVLSAIRHEVLKHNTMMLQGLIEAIETDQKAEEKADYFRQSLAGKGNGESVFARLENYASQLEKTGRSLRKRLNLKGKDPAMSVLFEGFGVLQKTMPSLDSLAQGKRVGKKALLHNLREAAELINDEGYFAVQELLEKLRATEIDRVFLEKIFMRTSREPAFASVNIEKPAIEVEADSILAVMITRRALEDILANLIRNALDSSRKDQCDPIHVGLTVISQIDTVTGLERLLFFVQDRSTTPLTTEMLRGRYIEEGLGLTADLVSRYNGSLEVREQSSPWSKAVVVKLPRAYPKDD